MRHVPFIPPDCAAVRNMRTAAFWRFAVPYGGRASFSGRAAVWYNTLSLGAGSGEETVMNTVTSHKRFLQGAAILAAASLISKILGVFYRVPYKAITGDVGLYAYAQVYPIYSTLLILATAGFPIAVSKIVAEKLAVGDVAGARRVFHVAAAFLSATGVACFALLFFGAPLIAALMGDPQLTMPIRMVSTALLVVPVMAAIRGYFQGQQNMMPTGVSQVLEQLVRIATILVLAIWAMETGRGVYAAASGALFGSFTGALAGLAVMLVYLRHDELRPLADRAASAPAVEPPGALIKKILALSLPIALGSLILPLMQLADSFTVKNVLDGAGLADVSGVWKGVYDRGQPLVQFSSFFAAALSLALVPSIAEANARDLRGTIQHRTELAVRMTVIVGWPASLGLAVIMEPVNTMLYGDPTGSFALAVLAFSTLFATLNVTAASILQGLGEVMVPVRNLIIGVAVKLVLNVVLIAALSPSGPAYGIAGASLATVIGYAVAMFLNLRVLRARTGVRFARRTLVVKPLLASLVMAGVVYGAYLALHRALLSCDLTLRAASIVESLLLTALGAVVYGAAVLRLGAVSRRDLEMVPKTRRLVPVLERLGMLKEGREA
jgi:Membrane protein involved in the export of O-antigen and teichoic acid|nr:polysaccharide biosynthesis protein [Bacillota bacterium]